MTQETPEPPAIAASAGPTCWTGVFDSQMLTVMGLKKFGTLPDGPTTIYEFATTLGIRGSVRLGDGGVFVTSVMITQLANTAELIDLLRLLRFFG